MGDFNFPNINWDTLDSDLSSGRFRDLILDNYLVQHVKQPTRDTNILDLVFTSDFNMVDNVDVIEHLGNSDHNILTWKLICDVPCCEFDVVKTSLGRHINIPPTFFDDVLPT